VSGEERHVLVIANETVAGRSLIEAIRMIPVGGEEATGAWAVMATLMIEILSADYIVLTAQYDMTKSVLL